MGKEIKKCLIITGAPEDDIDYYKQYIDGRFIIGADSGYQKCVKLNIKPNLIIGDFDSSTKPDTDIETIVLHNFLTSFNIKQKTRQGKAYYTALRTF